MKAPPAAIREGVTLREYTTWRVGGPAEWFAEPASAAELIAQASWAVAEGLAFRCIGAGSNLLIADGGLPGLTLCNRRLQGSVLDPEEGWVEAEAGEPIPTLARKVARVGLSGLEWSVGIPGTVGGFVRMNGGAYGREVADVLIDCAVILNDGSFITLNAEELDYSYRHSALPDGAMFEIEGAAFLKWRGKAFAWSHAGYAPAPTPDGQVEVLTPEGTIEAIAKGYKPVVHPSVNARPDR